MYNLFIYISYFIPNLFLSIRSRCFSLAISAACANMSSSVIGISVAVGSTPPPPDIQAKAEKVLICS